MNDTPTRRTIIKSAAWAMPVVAVAVSVPSAVASVAQPCKCVRLNQKGQPHYQVFYTDGTDQIFNNGEINRDKTLQALCRDKGPESH